MVPHLLLYAALVNNVRSLVARRDFAAAEYAVAAYRASAGATSELAAAISWMARAALDAHDYARADAYAAQARQMADGLLSTHALAGDPWLATAVGASIEVHSQALAGTGGRDQAVDFLNAQLALFGATGLHERIQKNLNLLSLVGKPAPPLEGVPASQLRGHPLLLFFWAHWCPDCKAEATALANLRRAFAPKGLLLVSPTKLYGYVARGEDAPPDTETRYISEIWRKYYAALEPSPTPIGSNNFMRYGASTTPTLVLVDARGIVRYYHPGALNQVELEAELVQTIGN
ncbi:MAG: TlpA disulfide reductase family protein [Bryobacteraceae bacterium]|jgi:thiol-disulfide isomerase/thioredoxin